MNLLHLNKYSTAAILLFGAAAVFIDIALLTNGGDITSSVYVISGMVCAITGIFTLTFSWSEPVDPRLIGILPVQGCINLCCTIHLLGISGNAYFLPPRVSEEVRVMQFNPTTSYKESEGSAKGSFRETGPAGLVTIPLCDPLIQELRKRNALVIPDKEEEITVLLRETIEDVFKFAPRVSARWHSNSVTITFHDYPSIDGCKIIAQGSPNCCTMNPCPMCSLCGVLIAEGRDKVVTLDKCSFTSSSRDVTAVFSILP
jgi:hypothetical protein